MSKKSRKLRGRIYIFFPEDAKTVKNNWCTEYYYLKKLLNERVLQKYGSYIKFYPRKKEREFLSRIKETLKKINQNPNCYEHPNLFYIIKDIDYTSNDNYKKQIVDMFKKYFKYINNTKLNFNIILSSRAWETWICMYDRVYSGQGNDIQIINKCSIFSENYEKNESWYTHNSLLYNDKKITTAYNNCKNERKNLFKVNTTIINPNINFQNNIKSKQDIQTKVNELCKVKTFSYVDILLHDIYQYIK